MFCTTTLCLHARGTLATHHAIELDMAKHACVHCSYEHRWVYDFEEFLAVAVHAGIPRTAVVHSTRLGADLPPSLVEAIHAAETVATARKQHNARENPTRCWLEQEVREPETLYVTITKPRPA